jgi:serine phosphatase RsbU (regulator of sigma subunit)
MRVTRRILLPALGFFLVAMVAMAGLVVVDVNRLTEDMERRELAQLKNLFVGRLENLRDSAKTMAAYVAAEPAVREAMAAGDRKRLLDLTRAPYRAAESVMAIPQFQFHVPPATSFLRVHEPDKFGDDLSSFRFTVVTANQEKRQIGGLEIGRGGLGIRGVVPVTSAAGHVGTAEFGLDLDQFQLDQLARQTGAHWQLLLARGPADIATFKSMGDLGPVQDLVLQATTLPKAIHGPAQVYRDALEGRDGVVHVRDGHGEYAMLVTPLRDYSGAVIAVLEVLRDRSDLVAARQQRILVGGGAIVTILLLGAILLVVLVSRNLNPIKPLTEQALAVAEGRLEVTEDIVAKGDDEVGQLATAVKRMGQQLVELIENLEMQVAARTSQLESTYQQIRVLNDRLTSENVRMGAELDVSRQLQKMILPTADEIARIAPLDIATFMEPASEVGGDYYDILTDGNHVRIGIGDVTGHGLESGVVMLMTQSAVRAMVSNSEQDSVRLMDVLNRTIYENVRRMGTDKNLTLALLEYRPPVGENTVGRLTVTGQHETVIVIRQDGTVDTIETLELGMPIGLIDDVSPFIAERSIELHPDDVVVLYTDGITEAACPDHTLYGVERLVDVAVRHRHEPAEAIKAAVVADVREHIRDQQVFDDLTLIVLKQR